MMSTHEAVQTILKQLPPDVSLHEVAREIEFIAGVREGFAQLDRGEGMPIEEVEKRIPQWAGK
jgi:predicted transcriptional regulator